MPCSGQQPGEVQSTRYLPFSPPSLPPLPPPLDIPNTDEIYDEISESPLTATTVVSNNSPDYEDGYILNVESVPKRGFGKLSHTGPTTGVEITHPRI